MNSKLLISLILVIVFSFSVVENKIFFNLEPREVETDCGKLSAPSAPKCCPTTCRKCNDVDKKKKSFCHWLKVGKNGRREKCCQYYSICKTNAKKVKTCYNTKRVCKWTSKLVKTYKKSNCYWQKHLGGKQRKCCKWTVKCFGNKCFNLRKKCAWRGKIVTISKEHGCRWVIIGKNTRRQKCCKQIRKCVGGRCTVRNTKNCRWNSLPIKVDYITRCKWHKKKGSNVKFCCNYFKRCVGKKCVITKDNCKVTDKTTIRRSQECIWKLSGKGRRKQCCTFSTVCNKNKLCRKMFRKCKWVGKVVWWTSIQKCRWQRKAKFTRQKRCCKYIKKCFGNKCKVKQTLCDWRGHPIYNRLIKNCKFVPDHKEGRKQFCCKRIKFCTKRGCKIINKKCAFTGLSIQWKTKTTCKWAKFKDYKQRRCCYSRKRCHNNKKCKTFKEACRYIGPKVTSQKKTVCKYVKEANGKRKNCCSFKRYCYGKKCKDLHKKCKTGKIISYRHKSNCFYSVIVKGWSRKVCCASAIKCLDKKCKTIRKVCKVTNKRKRTTSNLKTIEIRKKAYENDKKEKLKKLNFACNCFKQESQNLDVFREKRKNLSDKFKNCKKSQNNIKTLITKTKVQAQKDKLKVQLKKRATICHKIFDKLKLASKEVKSHKKYVKTKKIECTTEKNNYNVWIKKMRLDAKKFREYERDQERIERATLIKKYESKESKFKFKIEEREANIVKDYKKLGMECRKTRQDLVAVSKIASAVDKRFLRIEKKCKNTQKILKSQKKFLKKIQKKDNKKKNPLAHKFFLRIQLKTQKRESRFLNCKKLLEKVRVTKRKSDQNYKNAKKNNDNCNSQLRNKKITIYRIQRRETNIQKRLKKLLAPPKPPKKIVIIKKTAKKGSVRRIPKHHVKKTVKKGSVRRIPVRKTIRRNVARKNTVRRNTARRNVVKRNTVRRNVVRRVSVRRFAPVRRIVRRNVVRRNVVRRNVVRRNVVRRNVVRRNVVRRNVVRRAPVRRFAPVRRTVRRNIIRRNVVRRNVVRRAPVRRFAPVRRNVVRRVSVRRFAPVRRTVRRAAPARRGGRGRGGKGDVWLQDKNGNWIDVNVAGTFRYLKDLQNNFEIDVQFGQFGLGSVISALIVKARGNTIKAERNGKIYLNNRLIKDTTGKFVFNGNNVHLQKVVSKEAGLFVLEGLTKERFTFKYFKHLKSYDIETSSKDKSLSGLYVDPTNPKKYIISKNKSNFHKYVSYSYNDETEGNQEQKAKAEKCCRKLSKKDQARCRKDYYRTDVCFANEYKAKIPLREKNIKKLMHKKK